MSHVFVGMSGGVDSSVAALLLQREGYQVSGINLQLLRDASQNEDAENTSCAFTDSEDARLVAQRLGIPFHVADFSSFFRDTVIRYFISEYEAGRTPNPCVTCNRAVKFGVMLQHIQMLQGDFLATGHYAQVTQDPDSGRYLLCRGLGRSKDQSYFLYMLNQDQLSHTLFPLGGLHKEDVRALAEENGLLNARKRDSQDICFVPDGDYAAFIERTTGKSSPCGNFLDLQGTVLAEHKGFIRYTRGQRKGLGVSASAPLYVLDKDPVTHAIRLGPDSALWSSALTADHVNWISIPELTAPMAVTAKTRYSQREASATVEPLPDGRIRVLFDSPQRAITPGQAVVLYDGEVVVGGGTICE